MFDKIANVLESLAQYVEEVEKGKTQSLLEKKASHIEKIANKYIEKTGSEPSDNLLKLLLNTEPTELEKMAALIDTSSADFSIGKPSDKPDYQGDPEQEFINWIVS